MQGSRFHTRYQLQTMIGRGGMAEVYGGTLVGAEGFERPVAIKRLRPELSQNTKFGDSLAREARLASRLCHPNIAAVLDLDRDSEGRLFLVMERVEGVSLALFAHAGPLPVPVIITIMASILRGLAYAHGIGPGAVMPGSVSGIVHCDVSPHNVMVSWDGAVKLVDFGIARALERARPDSPIHALDGRSSPKPDGRGEPDSEPGPEDKSDGDGDANVSAVGKLGYMSPEQIHGVEIDGRADLFSAGVIFYELLSGRRLFHGRDQEQVLRQVLCKKIAPPWLYRSAIPHDMAAVCMRMVARDRRMRYPTCAHALDSLSACPVARDALASTAPRIELSEILRRRCADLAPPLNRDPEFLSQRSVPLLPSLVMDGEHSEASRLMDAATRSVPEPPLSDLNVGSGSGPAHHRSGAAPYRRPPWLTGGLVVAILFALVAMAIALFLVRGT